MTLVLNAWEVTGIVYPQQFFTLRGKLYGHPRLKEGALVTLYNVKLSRASWGGFQAKSQGQFKLLLGHQRGHSIKRLLSPQRIEETAHA